MDDLLDEMNLPQGSNTEELETISANKFKPKFDVKKFEFIKEIGRDKGIDFAIELKYNEKHTNFRFHIQLKATEKIKKNRDGTISLKVNLTNINYLLNAAPAYYVLYFQKEDKFFYSSIGDFVKSLKDKSKEWQSQNSHVLRFKNELTAKAIDKIFDDAMAFGKLRRRLTEKLVVESSFVSPEDKVTIDENLNVTGDAEIRRLIEGLGLTFINEARWGEIVTMHKRASQTVGTTAKYNLIVGVSFYHTGELAEAFSSIRKALRLKAELPKELQEYLDLFSLIVNVALGVIEQSEFEEKASKLKMHKDLEYQLRIATAHRNFTSQGHKGFRERLDEFLNELNKVIQDPNASPGIKAIARSVWVLPAGKAIHEAYTSSVPRLKVIEAQFGPNPELRKVELQNALSIQLDWANKVNTLKNELLESKKHFEFFIVLMDEARTQYELDSYLEYFSFDPAALKKLAAERQQMMNTMLERVRQAVKFYRQIRHIENLTAALDLEYQMLDYLHEQGQSAIVLAELTDVINAYDLPDHKRKLEVLKNEGPFHKRLATLMDGIKQRGSDNHAEQERLTAEMKQMDKEDFKTNIRQKGMIQLVPIGMFQFPEKSRSLVYDILNITPEARVQFDRMYELNTIPVANIYKNPVDQEGYGDGLVMVTGIESIRNIHRIRKAFFENGISRPPKSVKSKT